MATTYIGEYVSNLISVLQRLDQHQVAQLIQEVEACRQRGGCIYVFGNGGSAATSSHFVVDMGKGASRVPGQRFKILALTDNVSWITALGNDESYQRVFVGQLENYLSDKDLVIGISVSGNSENVVAGIRLALSLGCSTAALTGQNGELSKLAKTVVSVPASHFGLVEDVHLIVAHIVSYYFMERASAALPAKE